MGKYSALWFCIVPPFGQANTTSLELNNISPYYHPTSFDFTVLHICKFCCSFTTDAIWVHTHSGLYWNAVRDANIMHDFHNVS